MHVPSGLFVYGLYQREQNNGTQWKTPIFNGNPLYDVNAKARLTNSAANETDVWYVKAGIKRAWMPVGATVLFGEWGRYKDQFTGLCGVPGASTDATSASATDGTACITSLPVGVVQSGQFKGQAVLRPAAVTGSEVDR